MKVWSNAIRSLLLWTWMCEPKCPCRCEHQRAHQPSCKHQQNLFFRYCHSGANTGAFFVSIKNKVSKVNNLLCSHFLPFTPLYFWGGSGSNTKQTKKKKGKKFSSSFFSWPKIYINNSNIRMWRTEWYEWEEIEHYDKVCFLLQDGYESMRETFSLSLCVYVCVWAKTLDAVG